jgi:hypothetical protein
MADNYTAERIGAPVPGAPAFGRETMAEPKVVDNLVKPVKPVVEQAPTGEDQAPAAATEEKTEETVTLSPQMAALARKETRFRQQEQALKEREKALKEQEKAISAKAEKLAKLEELEQKLSKKDYSGIESLIDYDSYTQYLLSKQDGVTPEQQQIQKLTADLEVLKKSQSDDIDKRFDAAVQERKRAVEALVASSADYSTIKELKQEGAVVQHILDTWEEDSVDLSPEQAAKEVEEVLLERAKAFTGISKLQPKAEPAQEAPPQESKPVPPNKPTGAKTLTNSMQAMGEIKRPSKPLHMMTDSERYAEARRRAEEKIKKQQGAA